MRFQIPEVPGVDQVLYLGGLLGVLVVIVRHQRVVFVEDRLLGGNALHHVVEHVLRWIELRLLFEIPASCPVGEPGLAVPFLVDARHDAQERGLARPVRPQHADLRIGIKLQMHIVEDLLAPGIGLRKAMHMIDELARHDDALMGCWRAYSGAARDV